MLVNKVDYDNFIYSEQLAPTWEAHLLEISYLSFSRKQPLVPVDMEGFIAWMSHYVVPLGPTVLQMYADCYPDNATLIGSGNADWDRLAAKALLPLAEIPSAPTEGEVVQLRREYMLHHSPLLITFIPSWDDLIRVIGNEVEVCSAQQHGQTVTLSLLGTEKRLLVSDCGHSFMLVIFPGHDSAGPEIMKYYHRRLPALDGQLLFLSMQEDTCIPVLLEENGQITNRARASLANGLQVQWSKDYVSSKLRREFAE